MKALCSLRRLAPGLLAVLDLPACGEAEPGAGGTTGATSTGTGMVDEAFYALRVHVALTDDGQGVPIGAQNGAVVHVPATDIIGKNLVWATTVGGEPIFNVLPTENGATVVKVDLTADYQASARYANGPWEMALFVSIAGDSPLKGPQPGDLAGFDNDPPPEGQPSVTGISIRMTVKDADADVSLSNKHFIQY